VAVAGAYARLIAGDLIRLLLVDDDAMVRAGLTRLLEGYADIGACAPRVAAQFGEATAPTETGR
jgi:DNA-binding NarL/FixJ family response regulator